VKKKKGNAQYSFSQLNWRGAGKAEGSPWVVVPKLFSGAIIEIQKKIPAPYTVLH
jgi:hypothetical protein